MSCPFWTERNNQVDREGLFEPKANDLVDRKGLVWTENERSSGSERSCLDRK